MKISDDPQKSTLPGIQQVERLYKNDIPIQDIIYDIELGKGIDTTQEFDSCTQLLISILQKGAQVYTPPPLNEIRATFITQVESYTEYAPKPYPVLIGSKLQKTIDSLTRNIKI